MKRIVAIGLVLLTTACATSAVSADSTFVEGLDQQATQEVLSDSSFQEAVKEYEGSDAEIYLQGNVLARLMCLDLMDYYVQWHETGVRPDQAPALPQPTNPDEGNMMSLAAVQDQIIDDANARGLEGLAEHLGGTKGCANQSIGDGATIAARVYALDSETHVSQ